MSPIQPVTTTRRFVAALAVAVVVDTLLAIPVVALNLTGYGFVLNLVVLFVLSCLLAKPLEAGVVWAIRSWLLATRLSLIPATALESAPFVSVIPWWTLAVCYSWLKERGKLPLWFDQFPDAIMDLRGKRSGGGGPGPDERPPSVGAPNER